MAHSLSSDLDAVVGKEIWLPLGEDATGIVIGDFTSVWLMLDGVLVADQAPYAIQLVEVDDVGAPGYYFIRITPQAKGTLHLHMVHTAHDFDYTMQVEPVPVPVDPGLEGDYTITVSNGAAVVEGALVRVYDAAGTTFITRGLTDALGQVVFTLPVGTYQTRTSKAGLDFTAVNPTPIIVTANEENAPVLRDLLPTSASIGDWVVIYGSFFADAPDTEVIFGTEATVAADAVSPYLDYLLVQVPVGLTAVSIPVQVQKPDPNDLPLGKLISNTLTLVRV
jgi:hypothetical protein